MKILLTLTAYPPAIGGAQIHTHKLACGLANNHDIQVISHWDENRTDWLIGTTLKAPEKPRIYQLDGIPVHRLGLNVLEKIKISPFVAAYFPLMDLCLPALAANLEQHICKIAQASDLVHNVRIGREPLSYASYNFARKRGLPFIFTPLHHPRWSGWLYRHYQRLYRKADALIVLTEAEKITLASFGVDEKKIYITGIGPVLAEQADPVRFRERYRLKDHPFVLFLGQKYPYKGVEAVVKSASLVWQRLPEVRFVMIGPPTPYSQRLFKEFKDDRIIDPGSVDLQTKTDALAACSLLCVPSIQESFGGIFTEAWSFDKPVIGGNIPAVAEVVDHEHNGFLTAQKPETIADYIIALLSDPSLAQKMGESGKAKVEKRYSWDYLTQLTEQIYQSVRNQ